MTQTLAENFIILHQQENLQVDQNDRLLVTILDTATPHEKFSPKTTINVIAGAILGALAGVIAIFALEYIQSGYIRKPEDIERVLGLSVLLGRLVRERQEMDPDRTVNSQPPPRHRDAAERPVGASA